MRFSTLPILSATALLASLVSAGLENVKAGKHLTVTNFDSAIAGKDALISFYAPWCGHCKTLAPTWEKLALDFQDEEDVLIGQVDADNAANKAVAARYGVKGFPTIKFFPADGSAPRDYQSARTEEAFIEYINAQAGTHRTAGGLLNDLAGRIPSLDALAATFLSTSTDARNSIVAQAQELAASLTGSASAAQASTSGATKANANKAQNIAAAYYVKVMEKIGQSNDWAQTELARLQKLVSKRGTMAGRQLDDLQIRQNVLAAFVAAKASASSILSDANASVGSATANLGAGASSASNSASSLASQASASVVSAASAVSASAQSVVGGGASASVSSGSKVAAGSASSVSASVAASASSGSKVASSAASSASASVSLASKVAAASASSASKVAAASASSLSAAAGASASSVSGAAANAAGSVYNSAVSGGNAASATVKSAASQVSASVDSAISEVSSTVSSAASVVSSTVSSAASAASSAGQRIIDEL